MVRVGPVGDTVVMEPTTHDDGGTDTDAPRRLRRPFERQLGGVCAGLGRYVGVNPLFFRIAFVVLVFASGFGLFTYLGAWLLLPDDTDTDPRQLAVTASVPALIGGFATLVIGSIVLTSDIDLDFSLLVPLCLVILGIWVLNQRRFPDEATVPFAAPAPPANPRVVPPPPATPPPPTAWGASPVAQPAPPADPQPTDDPRQPAAAEGATFAMAGSTGSASDSPADPEPAAGDEVVTTAGPEVASAVAGAVPSSAVPSSAVPSSAVPSSAVPTGGSDWVAAASYTAPPKPSASGPGGPARPGGGAWAHVHDDPETGPEEPPGPPIVPITLAATVVVIGAYLVIVNLSSLDVGTSLAFGGILTALGGGLVASAFTRRALVLVPLAFLAGFFLLISPVLDATSHGGLGTRIVNASGDDLQDRYAIGAGELLIDLRDVELTEDRKIEIDVGAGYTEIRLPSDLPVVVEATSAAGYLEVLGAIDEGVGNQLVVSDDPVDGQPATLVLEASVTFGYVEVTRG